MTTHSHQVAGLENEWSHKPNPPFAFMPNLPFTSAPVPYVLKIADIISTHRTVAMFVTDELKDIRTTFSEQRTCMFMTYRRTKFHVPSSNGSLVTAIKPKTIDTFLILLPYMMSASKSRWRSCRTSLTNLRVHRVAERIK